MAEVTEPNSIGASVNQSKDLANSGVSVFLLQSSLADGTNLVQLESQFILLLLETLHKGAHLFGQLLSASRMGGTGSCDKKRVNCRTLKDCVALFFTFRLRLDQRCLLVDDSGRAKRHLVVAALGHSLNHLLGWLGVGRRGSS